MRTPAELLRERRAVRHEQRKLDLAGIFVAHQCNPDAPYWCRMSGLLNVHLDTRRAGIFGLEGSRAKYVREWYRALRAVGVRPPWAVALARAFWRTYESVTVGVVSEAPEVWRWGKKQTDAAMHARRLGVGRLPAAAMRSSPSDQDVTAL